MKTIVTHSSPDLDAITSVWVIKRYLQGWEDAQVKFVPAGERLKGAEVASENFRLHNADKLGLKKKKVEGANVQSENFESSPRHAIENIRGDEVIHVDTGMGPLDHHQTSDANVCAASRAWDFIKEDYKEHGEKMREEKVEAIDRIVKVVVDVDHFKEVFWKDPEADHYEFNLVGILDGLKLFKPDQDQYYTDFIMEALDGLLHAFENRIWAEKEIKENGKIFETQFGKGIGFETINDTVIKLSQKMGYVVVVRKDPRKGYVRIKVLPSKLKIEKGKLKNNDLDIDLTLVYEQLRKMDPDATWFLHVSKKMLLNGSVKNPKMKPTKLSLGEIIKVLESV